MPRPNIDLEPSSTHTTTSQTRETGYPWLFLYTRRSWAIGLVVTLLVIVLGGAFYVWYDRPGNDTGPDSMVGLGYAVVGTIFLILAAVSYSLRRRLRKRAIGQLNASLNWHVYFAIIGLAMILMHSFGNFEALSGTYALYAMIALTVSGFVGRALDHVMPRLIAAEVHKVLTAQGEDRVTTISQKLQAIVVHNTQQALHGFTVSPASCHPTVSPASCHPERSEGSLSGSNLPMPLKLNTPWDLAYISLEPTQQELDRDASQHPFRPDKKSALARSGATMPGAQEQISALQDLNGSMQREQFYRYVIHYWRVFHISLALLTIGLVIWHLVFAAQLLLPTMLQSW